MNEQAKERMRTLFQDVESALPQTDPEFVDLIVNFSQDEVIHVGQLTERERMLCILSGLLGCQGLGVYGQMVQAALRTGLDPVAIKEVVYQATAYLGIGRTYDFLLKTNEVMQAAGIALPLPGQKTTTQEDRFEKGLDKQASFFGEQMRAVQSDGPVLRKNINRWLADNCFGDYYTRQGLNDQEREMITFCLILAQGGCESQLRAHTNGNFGVGNDAAKLYQVVEQCMPYIGYPRSLNALAIIDEVAAQQAK